MISTKWKLGCAFTLLLAAGACGAADDRLGEGGDGGARAASQLFRYNRDYVFIGPREEDPILVPFTFRSSEEGDELQRGFQAWLARGGTWERFLDESVRTSSAGGVWRVVPHPDLEIAVGGPTEVESLRFQRGERRLRLDLESPMTSWSQGGETRFRLISGQLTIGSETIRGPILEVLRVERTLEDGWPPGIDFDAMFLTSGDSLQLVLAETIGGSEDDVQYAWSRTPAGERMWPGVEIQWTELRPYEEARRDIPRRWTFNIPGSGISGDVEAVGFDAVLGPERAGRRAVEIRYSVNGTVQLQGETRAVVGMIRHTQQ